MSVCLIFVGLKSRSIKSFPSLVKPKSLNLLSAVERSNPKDYKWKFNFVRTYIFVKNEIPRGKAKAPKSVVPEEIITKDDILLKIEKAKEKIANLKNLPRKANFNHPYFGNLNLKQTIKFLNLHIEHHLKIINDILSN